MAARKALEDLQREATCPICLEYFKDPNITDCGHNFCHACITHSWRDSYLSHCPSCRLLCQPSHLRPNRQLLSIVDIVKEFFQKTVSAQEAKTCDKHDEEKLKFFCQDDQKAICVICRESREHRHHNVLPIEEAAEDYKTKESLTEGAQRQMALTGTLKTLLAPVDLEIDSIKQKQSETERKVKELLKSIETERLDAVAKFQKLHQTLYQQENIFLNNLKEMNKKIVMTAIATLTNTSSDLSTLTKLKLDIEEKRKQLPDQLLKDIKSTLKRCKDAELEASEKNVKKCKVSSEYLTFDPKTANREIILSGDRRSAKRGEPLLHLPDGPERFDTATCVVSCEGFSSGEHYWEVDVGDGRFWAVGIVKESIKRKGRIKESPQEGIWVIDWCDGHHWALSSPQEQLSLAEKPKRISVFLNYEAGWLSFYNGNTMEHIYTFQDTFKNKVHPYFWVGNKTELRLL